MSWVFVLLFCRWVSQFRRWAMYSPNHISLSAVPFPGSGNCLFPHSQLHLSVFFVLFCFPCLSISVCTPYYMFLGCFVYGFLYFPPLFFLFYFTFPFMRGVCPDYGYRCVIVCCAALFLLRLNWFCEFALCDVLSCINIATPPVDRPCCGWLVSFFWWGYYSIPVGYVVWAIWDVRFLYCI